MNCKRFPLKVRFKSKQKAKNAMRRTPDTEGLNIYNCTFCQDWHVGHKQNNINWDKLKTHYD